MVGWSGARHDPKLGWLQGVDLQEAIGVLAGRRLAGSPALLRVLLALRPTSRIPSLWYPLDSEGHVLSDFARARAAVFESLRGALVGKLQAWRLNIGSFIDIEDESGERVRTVHFADAVSVAHQATRRPRQ
jgi:hypothetical protein